MKNMKIKFNWNDVDDGRPTPWAVFCRKHGVVYLSRCEYDRQMNNPDSLWNCPICGRLASWDDDNYELACEEQEEFYNLSEESSKLLNSSIESAKDGNIVDLGSFSKYEKD
jgi:hypothetical protein